jgi:helix-hairpin-helix protein
MAKLKIVLAGVSFVALLALGLISTTPVDVLAQAGKTAATQVDINSASQADLEKLPGIGEATAKKIISGRPYQTVGDLAKVGVHKNTIEKITPMVTVGSAAPAAAKAAPAPAAPAETKKAAPANAAKAAATTEAKTPPAKGMVWVNTDSKVFHREGDRWYGKTKAGKYMTEADALKDGYRPAKEGAAKKKE